LPPTRSEVSKQSKSIPASFTFFAEVSPLMPAPMMATLGVAVMGGPPVRYVTGVTGFPKVAARPSTAITFVHIRASALVGAAMTVALN
jgi:hypothetical protein